MWVLEEGDAAAQSQYPWAHRCGTALSRCQGEPGGHQLGCPRHGTEGDSEVVPYLQLRECIGEGSTQGYFLGSKNDDPLSMLLRMQDHAMEEGGRAGCPI